MRQLGGHVETDVWQDTSRRKEYAPAGRGRPSHVQQEYSCVQIADLQATLQATLTSDFSRKFMATSCILSRCGPSWSWLSPEPRCARSDSAVFEESAPGVIPQPDTSLPKMGRAVASAAISARATDLS
jgi:hypothetical protein